MRKGKVRLHGRKSNWADWKNKSGEVGSKITLAPANIQYTSEAIISYIEDGFTDIWANCVFEEGWTLEHAKIFY